MTKQAYPSVDGIAPSWSDIDVSMALLGGALVDVDGIKGVKTSRSLEVGSQKSGGRVTARTTGEESVDGSITFYRSGHRQFIKALMTIAPTRGNEVLIGIPVFDILVQHQPPGESEIYQRKLIGCRYLGDTLDMGEGTDADELECPLSVMRVVDIIDGKEVVLI